MDYLQHVSEPRMPNSERFVFDIAEPDIKMAPKLAQLPPSSTVNDGTANDPLRKQAVIDNEVSEQLRKDVTVDGTVGEPPKKESIVEGTAGEELSDNNMVPDEDDATNAVRIHSGRTSSPLEINYKYKPSSTEISSQNLAQRFIGLLKKFRFQVKKSHEDGTKWRDVKSFVMVYAFISSSISLLFWMSIAFMLKYA